MNPRPAVALLVCSQLSVAACAPHAVPATAPLPHVILAEAAPAPLSPPAPAASTASPAPPPAAASTESTEDRRSRHASRRLGWISIGVGASAGLLALGTSYLMLQDNGTRSSNCNGKVCSTAGFAANSQLSDLGPWNAGAWAVAAVGLGLGAFLLITNPADSSQNTQVGVGPTGSGAGLTLRSTF